MPFSSFTIKNVQKEFSLEIIDNVDLFSGMEPREISNHLKETLSDNVFIAVSVNKKKPVRN